MARAVLRAALVAATLAILGGCAHRDLKAPCSREDGLFGWLISPAYADGGCGPMRGLNGPERSPR
ncbi:hypothetical protein SAMN05519103_08600 [Rhizobiales bacterium GAS113]|nr:hypothetical protein SAMN05519103_08600 [Rhizobiales bacterium GAS113]